MNVQISQESSIISGGVDTNDITESSHQGASNLSHNELASVKKIKPILVFRPALSSSDLKQNDTLSAVSVGSGAAQIAKSASVNSVPVTEDDQDLLSLSKDIGVVYAMNTFVANLEGQVCVLKGDALVLLDDTNSYWWLVRCLKTAEVGYIPAENIETQPEKLARLNKQRNMRLAAPREMDFKIDDNSGMSSSVPAELTEINRALESGIFNVKSLSDQMDGEDQDRHNEPQRSSTGSPKHRSGLRSSGKFSSSNNNNNHNKSVKFNDQVLAIRHSDDESSSGSVETVGQDDSLMSSFEADPKTSKQQQQSAMQSFGGAMLKFFNGIRKPMKSSQIVGKVSDEDLQIGQSEDSVKQKVKTPESVIDNKVIKSQLATSSKQSVGRKSSSDRVSRKSSDRLQLSTDHPPSNKSSLSVHSKQMDLQREELASPIQQSQSSTNALMVLKIFSGNYDFKATYKTVQVGKQTKVSEVIALALVKFKVAGAVLPSKALNSSPIVAPTALLDSLPVDGDQLNDKSQSQSFGESAHDQTIPVQELLKYYYLSVVHGDSKEKVVNFNEPILDVLLRLQSKSIRPGVAPSSQKGILRYLESVSADGKISSIRTPNDSEIKFLLNLKSNVQPEYVIEDQYLIRVYYHGDTFVNGVMQAVKTLGVKSDLKMKEVVELAQKKFKLSPLQRAVGNFIDCSEDFHLWKVREEVTSLGANSQASLTLSALDLLQRPHQQLISIMKPDIMISDELKFGDVVKSFMIEQETDSLEEGQLNFVLQRNPSSHNSGSSSRTALNDDLTPTATIIGQAQIASIDEDYFGGNQQSQKSNSSPTMGVRNAAMQKQSPQPRRPERTVAPSPLSQSILPSNSTITSLDQSGTLFQDQYVESSHLSSFNLILPVVDAQQSKNMELSSTQKNVNTNHLASQTVDQQSIVDISVPQGVEASNDIINDVLNVYENQTNLQASPSSHRPRHGSNQESSVNEDSQPGSRDNMVLQRAKQPTVDSTPQSTNESSLLGSDAGSDLNSSSRVNVLSKDTINSSVQQAAPSSQSLLSSDSSGGTNQTPPNVHKQKSMDSLSKPKHASEIRRASADMTNKKMKVQKPQQRAEIAQLIKEQSSGKFNDDEEHRRQGEEYLQKFLGTVNSPSAKRQSVSSTVSSASSSNSNSSSAVKRSMLINSQSRTISNFSIGNNGRSPMIESMGELEAGADGNGMRLPQEPVHPDIPYIYGIDYGIYASPKQSRTQQSVKAKRLSQQGNGDQSFMGNLVVASSSSSSALSPSQQRQIKKQQRDIKRNQMRLKEISAAATATAEPSTTANSSLESSISDRLNSTSRRTSVQNSLLESTSTLESTDRIIATEPAILNEILEEIVKKKTARLGLYRDSQDGSEASGNNSDSQLIE
ncbi:hypothetical protein MP228_000145 [Amoeboaphelidium protococcarum]|nr:hypothetical protein MP228_000145 [Amoeboaphelidium protococcarum]